MVAPAARSFSTTEQCAAAGVALASQPGLPPPVRSPAMAYMSLTTALSPASGPAAAPLSGAFKSCGTKKPLMLNSHAALSFRGARAASEPGIQTHVRNLFLDSGCRPSVGPGMTEGSLRRSCFFLLRAEIPVEDFFAAPAGDAGLGQNVLEGALDVLDAVRLPGQIG